MIGLPDEDAGELPLAFIVRKRGKEVSEKEVEKFVEGILLNNFSIMNLH